MDVTICPTCLKSLILPRNIFDRKNQHLLNFLIRILDCKIEATDGTFYICLNCVRTLKSCWIFKLNCEKSIGKLRDIEKDARFLENEVIILMKDDRTEGSNDSEDTSGNFNDTLKLPNEHKITLLEKDIDPPNVQSTSELNNITTKKDSVTEDVDCTNKNPVVLQQKKAKPNKLITSGPICKAQVKYLSMHKKMVHIKVREQKPLNILQNVEITNGNNTTEDAAQEHHEIEIKDDEESLDIKENSRVVFKKRRDMQIKDIYLEHRKPLEKKMGRPRKVNKPDHFLCNHCGYKASTITRLNNHLKTHTGDKPFECSICGKRFNVIASMRGHEARHLDVRQFPCDICGKLYMSKNEARMHRVMHETKTQECYVCKKHFCRPQLLKIHMRRHTDADKFSCHQCDAKFHINRLLTRHIIDAHTKERPYKCTYCPRDFKFIERCNAHEKIHKRIKPYSCSCCSFVTTAPYSLTIHMRRHPEDLPQLDNPHKCELCYRCFSTKAMLLSHTKNVHLMAVTLEEHVTVQPNEEQLIGGWH